MSQFNPIPYPTKARVINVPKEIKMKKGLEAFATLRKGNVVEYAYIEDGDIYTVWIGKTALKVPGQIFTAIFKPIEPIA